MSLHNLYSRAHKLELFRPALNRMIRLVYDMKKMLQPYLNPAMYFTIPHVFFLRRKFAKCILQYTLFSSFKTLLPQEPDLCTGMVCRLLLLFYCYYYHYIIIAILLYVYNEDSILLF